MLLVSGKETLLGLRGLVMVSMNVKLIGVQGFGFILAKMESVWSFF